MDKYGNSTQNGAKHFMVSGCGTDCCALVIKTTAEIEMAYRLWAGNKVNEEDIKDIQKLNIEAGFGCNFIIGNITPLEKLPKDYHTADGMPDSCWEGCFVLRGCAVKPCFVSRTIKTPSPVKSLASFYKRYPEPWMVTHE